MTTGLTRGRTSLGTTEVRRKVDTDRRTRGKEGTKNVEEVEDTRDTEDRARRKTGGREEDTLSQSNGNVRLWVDPALSRTTAAAVDSCLAT